MLAGDVDAGPPFGVGEGYARLALCRRNQVTHGPIVRGRPPAYMPTGRYSPGGQKAAAKGELLKNSVNAKFAEFTFHEVG